MSPSASSAHAQDARLPQRSIDSVHKGGVFLALGGFFLTDVEGLLRLLEGKRREHTRSASKKCEFLFDECLRNQSPEDHEVIASRVKISTRPAFHLGLPALTTKAGIED